MPFYAAMDALLAQATVVNTDIVAVFGQHLVLSDSRQFARCRDLLAQLQRSLAATVLAASTSLGLFCIETREHLIRCTIDPVRHSVRVHQVDVRILDITDAALGRMDGVLVRFLSDQVPHESLCKFDQLRDG